VDEEAKVAFAAVATCVDADFNFSPPFNADEDDADDEDEDDDEDDDEDEDEDDDEDDCDRNAACPCLKSLMNIMLNALPSAHFMHTLVAPASTRTSAQTSSAARSTSSTCKDLSQYTITHRRKAEKLCGCLVVQL
jgi:hypothetical protein